jgi:hypothetical protein
MTIVCHLTTFSDTPEKKAKIEAVVKSASDWILYAPNCWYVAFNNEHELDAFEEELSKATAPFGIWVLSKIVSGAGLTRAMLPNSVWEWLRKQGLKLFNIKQYNPDGAK